MAVDCIPQRGHLCTDHAMTGLVWQVELGVAQL